MNLKDGAVLLRRPFRYDRSDTRAIVFVLTQLPVKRDRKIVMHLIVQTGLTGSKLTPHAIRLYQRIRVRRLRFQGFA